jgi:hypothetical protein
MDILTIEALNKKKELQKNLIYTGMMICVYLDYQKDKRFSKKQISIRYGLDTLKQRYMDNLLEMEKLK